MTEIRCVKCKRRLFDICEDSFIKGLEIQCPKCGYKNSPVVLGGKLMGHHIIEPTYINKKGKIYIGKELPVKS